MDFTAAVFPVGRLKSESYRCLDVTTDVTLPESPRNMTEQYIRSQWSPQTYENAAISLQLVGRRLNEEKVLGMLGKVEDAVKHDRCNGTG